ncbi:MAG: 50S ribosomal protein L13 [bacterium]
MKTTYPKKEEVQKRYVLFDADGVVLGKLAVRAASVLRGKDKPIFHPAVDTGDFVIIVNAEKVHLTGKKMKEKIHYRHSQYPGGLKATPYGELLKKQPERVIYNAVRRMLPKNYLSRDLLKKLKVYAGPDHPHKAQKPVKIDLPKYGV